MAVQQHLLEIYEPYEYAGENPLCVEGVAVMAGPSRETYYLLKVTHPFEYQDETVEQIAILPRYNEDKIDRAVSSSCTVNIARIPVGVTLSDKDRLKFSDILSWGVGKISPCPE